MLLHLCGINPRAAASHGERKEWKESIKQLRMNQVMQEIKDAGKEMAILD